MAEDDTLFPSSSGQAPEKRPVRKAPTFTPFVVAAIFLVSIWGVLTFVFPDRSADPSASTIMKNTLRQLSPADMTTGSHR
ncbi:hypothetical protein [Acetobacter sp.]|jgi:hypothetical protein|uniref:hypothetical protein n=1 Tax=Acetobacter sp. TaxID=440 RepID=UPI0025C53632|nr:hypothetical protein [Acetobacter sp.]MCH4090851.1 hypothetical protein [Acetobacter sp.]MCI1301065.1 hypothetical protein [Acetobacter sp.]MCI1317389.1 hypothetical protein [Acetobacter sp.]